MKPHTRPTTTSSAAETTPVSRQTRALRLPPAIDPAEDSPHAGLVSHTFAGAPDPNGVLMRLPVTVPDFEDACYYACSQKHDPLGQANGYWPGGANRMQALRISDFSDLTHGGSLLLLQLTSGQHLALLPIAGAVAVAYFTSYDRALHMEVATWGTAPAEGELPLVAWGLGDTPFQAVRRAWQPVFAHPQLGSATQPRASKDYPEMFGYLGWCTWEQYKFDINEAMLLDAIDHIEASGLPIRYALFDDGHLHHTKDRQLLSLEQDAGKFPDGWTKLLSRRGDLLKWFGLWLNFNGYWQAIAAHNQMGDLNDHLAPIPSGALKPAEGFLHAFAFYDAMIGAAQQAGYDFVKVDDQAQCLQQYQGVAHPVKQAGENSQALEAACAHHDQGLINCMAHNSVCLFNTRHSAVTRCSEDYKVNDLWRGKAHLHNSFANMLWFAPTVWGDHDMFHSNDPLAGQAMAISKAMSGGPIYISDDPTDFDPSNVWPLCLHDGQLLRPLAPGIPLPDSVYLNPFTQPEAYRTVAPLPNRAAAVAVFNLTHPDVPVNYTVDATDYKSAAALLDNPTPWEMPPEGLLLYDWHARQASVLSGPASQNACQSLPSFGCRLFLLAPIHHGWSVLGRPDKFLGPAAVEVNYAKADELIVSVPESAPILVWSSHPFTNDGQHPITAVGANLWRIDMPSSTAPASLRLRR